MAPRLAHLATRLVLALTLGACQGGAGGNAPAASTGPRGQPLAPASTPSGHAPAAPSGSPGLEPQTITDAASLRLVELYTAGARADEPLPLVVALHGLGDTPEAFGAALRELAVPARVLVPQAPAAHFRGYSWFAIDMWQPDPAAVARGVERAAQLVAQGIELWQKRFGGPSSIVVVGYSQGGMIAFELAVHHPERIHAAVALAGWLPPALVPTAAAPARMPPLFAVHGEQDEILAIERTRESVAALQRLGFPVELRTFAGVPHRPSAEMWRAAEERVAAEVRKLGDQR